MSCNDSPGCPGGGGQDQGRHVFDAVTQELLREAGVRYAFSYYNGFRRWDDWDDYDIRRVAVESEMTPDWFRSLVSMPGLFA